MRRRKSTSGNRVRRALLAAPLAILLAAGGCKAEAARESAACDGVPPLALAGRVTDAADVLDPAAEARLSDRLARYEQATRHQMVVATTPGLNGVRVDNFGTCLGNRWGIGDKDRDDGVLILIAPKERQMGIATGSGMENILPDDKTLEIVQQMTPHFAKGDYAGGLSEGIEAIAAQTGETP
nr:TPM domain-containing protein [Sphingopyxis panaciterrulae]